MIKKMCEAAIQIKLDCLNFVILIKKKNLNGATADTLYLYKMKNFQERTSNHINNNNIL